MVCFVYLCLLLQPKETRLISESGGLFKPEVVAKAALEDALVCLCLSCFECFRSIFCLQHINDKFEEGLNDSFAFFIGFLCPFSLCESVFISILYSLDFVSLGAES